MGRQLKQLKLLVKKNYLIILQRKGTAICEIFIPLIALFAFSFIPVNKETLCLGSYRPIDPLHRIWKDGAPSRKMIAMAPNTLFVQELADRMLQLKAYKLNGYEGLTTKIELDSQDYETQLQNIQNGDSRHLVIFPTTDSYHDYVHISSKYVQAGIVFTFDDNHKDKVNYTMEFHKKDGKDEESWATDKAYRVSVWEKTREVNKYVGYVQSGFSALQQLLDSSILLVKGATNLPNMVLRSAPTPGYVFDPFVSTVMAFLLPSIFLMTSFVMASGVCQDVVEEKCSKMREMMRMMGLSDVTMWCGWCVQRAFFIILPSALDTIALKFFGYYPNSDGTLVFVVLLVFLVAFNSYLFFATTLLHNPKTASGLMVFLTFLSYLPALVIGDANIDGLDWSLKMFLSIFPLTGFTFALKTIANWEIIGVGVQWSNVSLGVSSIVTFSLADALEMLVLDMLFYALIAWYIENVFPGNYGVANKPYFFLTKAYWKGADTTDKFETEREDENEREDATCHENLVHTLKPGIVIRKLNKTFKSLSGPKTAVKNLTIDMYEGQITALLGHNGAGKTTTLNMLTGMFPPTSGDAMVGGCSVVDDINGVRKSMGVCPQHNTLFKNMTVYQHLEFFIRLKGVEDDDKVEREIEFMLDTLEIEDKRDTLSKHLSGGMKRKLSVGIALSGGSKVVLLDEPSTGLDVAGKRDLWDMLLKMKAGRTIIITTHSMDEADLLGDRIAIMAAGKLVCSGSSFFLKRRYGVGYHLTLVKDSVDMTDSQVENLTTFIQSHVSSAECHSNVGSELSYLLNASQVGAFSDLFEALEADTSRYGVSSFGVSLTTMEEVFMKAGEGHDSNVAAIKYEKNERKIRKFARDELNTGFQLLVQQFMSQIVKRFILTKRSIFLTSSQFLIPTIIMIFGLVAFTGLQASLKGVPRALTLRDYPRQDVSSQLYYADLRSTDSGEFTSAIQTYLDTLNVVMTDVTQESKALMGSYGNSNESCCSNPYLQLSEGCINKMGPDGTDDLRNFTSCFESWNKEDFTYKSCRDKCLTAQNSYDCTVKGNPIRWPTVEDVEEQVNYFQNYFMDLVSKDTGSFYVDVQGGITLSDRSKMYIVHDATSGLIISEHPQVSTDNLVELSTSSVDVLTGWVSYRGLHVLPAIQNALSNLALVMSGSPATIHATHQPLPSTLDDEIGSVSPDILTLMIIYIFGMASLLGSFAQIPVLERTTKVKHLQQISGVDTTVYWASMFLWDFLIYVIVSIIIFILIFCFQVDGLTDVDRVGPYLLLILLGGYATVPFIYILSHLFSKYTSVNGNVNTIIGIFTLLCYIAFTLINLILYIPASSNDGPNKYDWIWILDGLFLFNPHYAVTMGIANLYTGKKDIETYKKCDSDCAYFKDKLADVMALDKTGIGRNVLALFIIGSFYHVALHVTEHYLSVLRALFMGLTAAGRKKGPAPVSLAEDANVATERNRVDDELDRLIGSDSVVMHNLHRQFGDITAVQNLSLAISPGECFGLLGVNGAGKTTTFNLMTGDLVMTSGRGWLYGYDVTKQLRTAQKFIGYCPQFDAVHGFMTGRELLTMFAHLRGIPLSSIDSSVAEIIRMFNLEDHADKKSSSYSGGNKRKLSTGVAIIGSPPLIFLDEPTAGMDPTARRFFWDVLCYLRNSGCCVVMTSHSMEECEALCTRIVIMVNGACRCLGGIQELKSTYSQGYRLGLLVDTAEQSRTANFVEENFTGALLKESYPGYLMFSLGADHKWSHIFKVMESNKEALNLLDYSVSDTSLEQVFLNFAKEQKDPEPKKKKWQLCCRKKDDLPKDISKVSLKISFVGENRNGLLNSKRDSAI